MDKKIIVFSADYSNKETFCNYNIVSQCHFPKKALEFIKHCIALAKRKSAQLTIEILKSGELSAKMTVPHGIFFKSMCAQFAELLLEADSILIMPHPEINAFASDITFSFTLKSTE